MLRGGSGWEFSGPSRVGLVNFQPGSGQVSQILTRAERASPWKNLGQFGLKISRVWRLLVWILVLALEVACIHLAKKSCKSSKNRILWVDLEKFLNFPRYILAEIQFLRGRANRADIKKFRAIRLRPKMGRVGSGWPFFGPYGPQAGRADGLWPDPPLVMLSITKDWKFFRICLASKIYTAV